jgi:Ran GTPase-activating protein (RanGAP) involved in mRNA processing and transport
MQSMRELERLVYVESTSLEPLKKEKSREFFKKHKNKYLINIILNFLTLEEKTKHRYMNKLVHNSINIDQEFNINLKNLKSFYQTAWENKLSFETCLLGFCLAKFKHANILISEFISAWAYNQYYKHITGNVSLDISISTLGDHSKQLLFDVLKRIKKPIDIYINNIGLNQLELNDLFESIKGKEVKSLTVINKLEFDENNSEIIAKILPTLKGLNKICFSTCIKSDEVMVNISNCLKKLYKLEKVEFNDCKLTKTGLDAFFNNIHKLKNLKSLSFNNSGINVEGANLIGLYLGSWMSDALTSLSLDDNRIGNGGMFHIMNGIRTNKNLSSISLNQINSFASGFEEFVNGLQNNQSLKKVRFCNNEVTHKMISYLNDTILPDTKIETVELFNKTIGPYKEIKIKLKEYSTHKILL